VTLKAAVSLDGKLAPAAGSRSEREPYWLTGPAARADVQQLRHASDALLTGIGTILADDPSLTDRTILPRRHPLLRVILDSHLRIPPDARLLNPVDNDLLIITSPTASSDAESLLRSLGAAVVRIPTEAMTDRLDLHALLESLHHRHIRSLLLEAGSAINASFLAAGLVDRVILYLSEIELGPDALPFATGRPSADLLQAQLTSITRTAFPHSPNSTLEDIRITGYLHDPWINI
jgi:diaminohydroxyphosphoribosylaminopyrimidine deaminase/5-amino-6-(5-phosphoribosylamino)uracil reductase